ncbi:MAG: site-specific DNA-methyltransferase [Ktedonobacteraceae bacterium]|nr:site-specific DNA-methyltransferase [Ktedonobacteraceae bacterium]MBV9713330.1 site-specific DNA-methyltransferase [Ktedonobacteraceae bacterium]
MAELVWKGKHQPHNENTFAAQEQIIQNSRPHQLMTQAYYPVQHGELVVPSVCSHEWQNRLIQGDNCEVLPALIHEFKSAIDLIYIDPPFMTGRTFSRGAEVAYSDTWNNDLDSYLQWLYETLHLLYTLLAPDGSLYVHLDWRTTHYAKMILDEIFSSGLQTDGAGFKNEIIWYYQSGGRSKKYFARKHDNILLYTKSGQYCFHSERVSIRRGAQKRNHMRKEVGTDGRISWSIRSAGRTYTYSEDSTMSVEDVWSDISHLHQRDPERTGYATQKPEALLERIILTSSEEQDLVLDCFCGSGVTPAVAEKLGRRWIASDRSKLAITTTQDRLLAGKHMQPFALQYVEETDKISCIPLE